MSNRTWVVTPEELSRGDLAAVQWHPAEISKYEEGQAGDNAKNPGSDTATFFFKILDGPNKGMEVRRVLSAVAWGFGKTLFATLNFPKDTKGNYLISDDLFHQTVGHKLMIYIKRGKNQQTGAEFNDVVDFKPMP